MALQTEIHGAPAPLLRCPECRGEGVLGVRATDCAHSRPCPCPTGEADCPDCIDGRLPCSGCGARAAEVLEADGTPYCRRCAEPDFADFYHLQDADR